MKLSDFNYELPDSKIAKVPAVPRDSSKLLVLDKNTGKIIDDHFYNLANYLQPGDLLVRNNTKVIPARIYGKKETGGKVEILLTKKIAHSASSETWECLTKPGIKPGQEIYFDSYDSTPTKKQKKSQPPLPAQIQNQQTKNLVATCISVTPERYTRIIEFNQMGPKFIETLEKIGITPLPPYIADTTADSDDIRQKYQTIYAKYDGSAAAPTAGLHFTKELETKLATKGVQIAEVTLHVGLGTFLPVKTENILDHHMHSEWFEITKETAKKINETKQAGGRIISVGTTSSRVLESASECKCVEKKCDYTNCFIKEKTGETDIFMYPGYRFKIVDGLITNFHLPKSTLLMLVSAVVTAPNTKNKFTNFLQTVVGQAYLHAIKNNYRFYSFGDGMLII